MTVAKSIAKDVSAEARDAHGRWTSGGISTALGQKIKGWLGGKEVSQVLHDAAASGLKTAKDPETIKSVLGAAINAAAGHLHPGHTTTDADVIAAMMQHVEVGLKMTASDARDTLRSVVGSLVGHRRTELAKAEDDDILAALERLHGLLGKEKTEKMDVAKDAEAADTHATTAIGNDKPPPKRKPRKVDPNAKLPVTGMTAAAMAAQGGQQPVGKAGARNSAADLAHIQAMHDHACALGATCADDDSGAASYVRKEELRGPDGRWISGGASEHDVDEHVDADRIEPPHEVFDDKKHEDLINAMREHGWKGRPILAYEGANGLQAVTGSHRIAAAREAGVEVPTMRIDDSRDGPLYHVDENGMSLDDHVATGDDRGLSNFLRQAGDSRSADLVDAEIKANLGKRIVKRDAGWSIPLIIAKADPDKRLVFGWASVVEKDGRPVVDKQGDIIPVEELEKAAYEFVLHSRENDDLHAGGPTGRCVESAVFTLEKQKALGIDLGKIGWWVGFKVDDDNLWAAHKRGERPEFSIGGAAVREDVIKESCESPDADDPAKPTN